MTIEWLKGQQCESSACFEVGRIDQDRLAIRDQNNTMIEVTQGMWDQFVQAVRAGAFDQITQD